MSEKPIGVAVYLEVGQKRVIANAVDWPGWARAGRDETSALQALLDHALRYARVVARISHDFTVPASVDSFDIVARLPGNAGTDFGALGAAFPEDARPVSEPKLRFYQALLEACWAALDQAAAGAAGRELRKGPRGGGRDLEAIRCHVAEAERGYLSRIGRKAPDLDTGDVGALETVVRQAVLDGLASAVREGVEPVGPRGGTRWSPREFVRHVAWHTLDHAWEIEDRVR